MKINIRILAVLVFGFLAINMNAMKKPEKKENLKNEDFFSASRADCQVAQSQIDLEVNNVRARLLTGGDMWWDLQNGTYIVPATGNTSALFAGGVWIGGVDPNQNIKLAGVQYRQNGQTDWYAGPLDDNGETDFDICEDWDEFFTVRGDDIRRHIANYERSVELGIPYNCDSIPAGVKYWPGKLNPFFGENYDFGVPDQNIGDFWDVNEDGIYNACDGDFPIIIIRDCEPEDARAARELLPDEMIFWVYNDAGGPHSLSQATKIQMEVQVQAFGYATNDEINDMTFYRYKLLNKAQEDIRNCYFAMWVDPDLGCSDDDYIGCDVERSLAYVYNEDALDGNPGTSCTGGVETYGDEIPLVGIDYFRGPRGPKIFQRDENDEIIRDSLGVPILEDPEFGTSNQDTLVELGMTSFIYQNRANAGTWPEATTDPDRDFEFYNILRGLWKDGTPLTLGGSGYDPEGTDTVRYAFPGSPDDNNEWSMCTAELGFGDRRTVQATGPLLLQPGAENELIIGAVFVPNVTYDCPDISRLQVADDLAQALFNSCFDIIDGPDAPDICAVELDEQLILVLSNDTLLLESNNAKEKYSEIDIVADEIIGEEDSLYVFEGYKLYQLANPNVTVQELDNVELARLIHQVDVKNGVTEIFNWESTPNPDPNASIDRVYFPVRQVSGADEGIQHSFNILSDQFADGDKRLVNHQNYYFTVVAYGYNNYKQFDPYTLSEDRGQAKPYLEGRKNIRTYTFTPRPTIYKELQVAYGQEAAVTRLSGVGTGFNALDLQDGVRESIIDGSIENVDGTNIVQYKAGNGPINPRVIDPLNIKNASYRLEVRGNYNESTNSLESGAKWVLINQTTGQTIASENTIEEINEQIIYAEGFSLSVNQVGEPGSGFDDSNGSIAQTVSYADPDESNWWNAVPAFTGLEVENPNDEDNPFFVYRYITLDSDEDPRYRLSSEGPEHFIPMQQARWGEGESPNNQAYYSPAWRDFQGFADSDNYTSLRLADLNNVDIVLTDDKSKWSECIVVEAASGLHTQAGLATPDGTQQFEVKTLSSIDQNGNEIEGTGKSYFPGYAIDVETGERLNIFFGENSIYNENNPEWDNFPSYEGSRNIGNDMIWNPTTDYFFDFGATAGNGVFNDILGGQHFIYVTRQKYDGCENLREEFESYNLIKFRQAVGFITWVGVPVPDEPLLPLAEGLIPNETTIKMRVNNGFNREVQTTDNVNPNKFEANGEQPTYEFAFTDVEAKDIAADDVESALDNVQVVPNPYYAYSSYEPDQFTNTVKVTNLPARAVVTIYSLDGKFIQQFNRDALPGVKEGSNPAIAQSQIIPSLEWNLKNNKGIPVASGVYIFHIYAPDLGVEKSIKWFGVNRRFDPTGL